ncbi:MAG: hypothetical protein ACI4WM_01445 [Erysipelotrichaceae bacterium]
MPFKELLEEHSVKYPHMETIDQIKLAYQAVYGPFHMHKSDYLSYLLNEDCNESEYIEYLGDKYARFYFDKNTDRKLLCKLFELSMVKEDNDELFIEYLKEIEGSEEYLKDGIRDIHHSKSYNEHYHPHYRLIKRDYAFYYPVIKEIYELTENNSKAVIEIDGMCCSGKSVLSDILNEIFDINIIHTDDFYLPKAERKENWFDFPGGNMNMEYLDECLKKGRYKKFSCNNQKYSNEYLIDSNKPILIEGTYSFMHDNCDLRVFLECSKDAQINRLKIREDDISSFENIWLVKERDYFNKLDVKNRADIIVDTDELF